MSKEELSIKFYQTDDDFKNNTVTVEVMPKSMSDEFERRHKETMQRLLKSISETNPDTLMTS